MTNEEWCRSTDTSAMLHAWFKGRSVLPKAEITTLHRFAIGCCWKHKHLIPQEALREGLRAGEQWIDGRISEKELNRRNYYAEGEAFFLDYCKKPEDINRIEALIDGIEELAGQPFEKARKRLMKAAYFAESAMILSTLSPKPRAQISTLLESDFLCPDLLREHLRPDFDAERLTRARR